MSSGATMVIMRDPSKFKCPYCGAIICQNEDTFCHNCLEWLPHPPLRGIGCAGH